MTEIKRAGESSATLSKEDIGLPSPFSGDGCYFHHMCLTILDDAPIPPKDELDRLFQQLVVRNTYMQLEFLNIANLDQCETDFGAGNHAC